ncbi:MAG: dihydroorotate dehydrogenase electron transfer subunit [Candidatus Delongbacteria bacterium]|jgi:dihydroorotate dehydrogenase electron transfer subunit|nr:dihydroorotate dehydrogenase electron transfer subunit [Candidatus Delongbacteria bacterium]
MKEPKYYEVKAEVVSVRELKHNVVTAILRSKEIADKTKPGQFVNIQVNNKNETVPVLRRPFAVSYTDGDNFEIIFDVVGRGTNILKDMLVVGEQVNVLGPLGNGFDINVNGKEKLLLAGGVGIAPIKKLMQYFTDKGDQVTLIWGNRDKSGFFDIDFFMDQNIKIFVATDDGSLGFEGNVLDILKSEIKNNNLKKINDYNIYVVGPNPMMKAVADYCSEMDHYCQVSLETPMACGIGVCQGCAVKKKKEDGYYLTCVDGPVFNSCDVEIP